MRVNMFSSWSDRWGLLFSISSTSWRISSISWMITVFMVGTKKAAYPRRIDGFRLSVL